MAMLVAAVAMLAIVMLAGTAYAHTNENGYEGISLEPTQQNRPPVPDVITWSISEESPEPRDRERVVLAIEKAFDIWAGLNPELNFKQVAEDGDISIFWDLDDGWGIAWTTDNYTGSMGFSLGNYDCRGELNEKASDRITSTMLHEIGHILGLGHHKDPKHLMRGSHPPPEDGPFETLGFNIPDRLHVGVFYVGSDQFYARYDVITDDIGSLFPNVDPELNERRDALEDALDCMRGTLPEDYGTLDQRVALLYDDVAILDAKLTSIQTTLNTINTSIDAILDRLVALETGTSELTPIIGIEGKVYNDSNNNDILDTGELGIPNRTVLVISLADPSDVNRLTTDSNGDYSIKLDAKSGWLVQVEGTNVYSYTTVQSAFTTVINLGL